MPSRRFQHELGRRGSLATFGDSFHTSAMLIFALLLFDAGVPVRSQFQPMSLHIVEATYGILESPEQRLDVTALVAQHATSGRLHLARVDNDTMGQDPASGRVKQLQVKYTTSVGGPVRTKVVDEGSEVCITGGGRDWKGEVLPYKPTRRHDVQRLVWTSESGALRCNGKRCRLKGVNWFGFETDSRFPHGLWQLKLDFVLDFLEKYQFNAVRLPFSLTMALDLQRKNEKWVEDEELRGISTAEILSRVMDRLGERGILVMLDMHRMDEQVIPDLWYDDNFTEADVLRGWDSVLDVCKDKWNVFALDLNNEPHGEACWGKGDEEKDWKAAAERITSHIIANHPEYKGLFFIEGINVTSQIDCDNPSPHAAWWGGSLEGLHKAPIQLNADEHSNRIVYSPHVYGPSVYMQEYFKAHNFPDNMPEIWMAQWGFAEQRTGRRIVIGEWGGWYKTKEDQTWQQALAKFLVEHDFTDQFYWCLNCDSGDTGGLLEDDWVTPVQPKLDLLATVQPHPSKIGPEGVTD